MNRTIRLFVSSTFSDFKAERDLLQREVFPKLQQLCLSKGLRFQAIDLRWGVPEEAGKDNCTMRICLRELKRCQEGEIKPNFLVLLGDRYGWRPLPETMSAEVFGGILENVEHRTSNFEHRSEEAAKQAAALMRAWYRLDDNALPAEYVLKPRTGRFEDFEVWQTEVERPLLAAICDVVQSVSHLRASAPLRETLLSARIGLSATHQEILCGALALPKGEARKHVHAFRRQIDGSLAAPHPAFTDCLADGSPDATSRLQIDRLCAELEGHLGKDNLHNYTVPWCGEGAFGDADLETFATDVYDTLKRVIEDQIAALEDVPPEVQEENAHRTFAEERRDGFVGREEPLRRVLEYLGIPGSTAGAMNPLPHESSRLVAPAVLAVVGPAGAGKSALMAEAVHRAAPLSSQDSRHATRDTRQTLVIARFIGVTPGSSDLIELLRELVARIRARYPREVGQGGTGVPPVASEASHEPREKVPDDREIPHEINPLTMAFHEALNRATAERPLWLFLDALDQFRDVNLAGSLSWLPQKLPEHVRIVVSAAEPGTAGFTNPLESSRLVAPAVLSDPRATIIRNLARIAPGGQTLRLDPLTPADGAELLDRWLAAAGRTLDDSQRKLILDAFAVEGNALWLRVAAEEASRWPCWHIPEPPPTGLHELLATVLERLSRNEEHGAVFVNRALGSLACARHGLAEDEIIGVLGADSTVMAEIIARSPTERVKAEADRIKALPVAIWVRFHGDIAFYLSERRAQGAALFGFYHRSFGEAVERFCLRAEADRLPLHETMARWFGEQPWFLPPAGEDRQPPRAPERSDPANTRKASELPFHLQRVAELTSDADRWDPLVDVLCDLDCVETKARSGLIYELVGDYNAALAELPEFRDENERLAKRDAAMIAYNKALREYAVVRCDWWFAKERGEVRSEPPYPPLPPELRDNAQTPIPEESSPRAARLRHYANFVSGHLAALAHSPDDTLPLAFNQSECGPVADQASMYIVEIKLPCLKRSPRPPAHPLRPQCLRTLEGHSAWVKCVSVSTDGRRVVSGSEDGAVRLWDMGTGESLRAIKGHSASVNSVSVTPDGQRAVTGSYDNSVQVWDLETGKCLRTLKGHCVSLILSVAVNPDGRCVVLGSQQDKIVRLWNLETGQCLRSLEGHTKWVNGVSISPDGRRAGTGSLDATVRIWDLETGQCLHILEGDRVGSVLSVSVSPDGRLAVAGNVVGTIQLWDMETGECLRTIKGHNNSVNSVSVSPDGRRVVSGSSDTTLRVWDIKTGECLRTLAGHTNWVTGVSVSPDGRRAVSGSDDKTLRLWDLDTGQCLSGIEGERYFSVLNVRVSSNGQRLVISGCDENPLRVWDMETGQCMRTLDEHAEEVTSVSMSSDGRRVISGNCDKRLRVWDLETGQCLRTLDEQAEDVTSVSMSPDGQRAVSGSHDKKLRVWDLETGQCLRTLAGHTEWVNGVSVSPDGRRAVSGSDDKTLRLWDLESGQCLRTLEGHASRVWSVSVSPDGRHAVSGSGDNTLRLWDLESGQCLRTFEGHSSQVWSVSVSPDGRRAVSGSEDNTLRLWDLVSAQCLGVYHAGAYVQSVAFSSNGCRIICGTEYGQICFLTPINMPPSGPAFVTATNLSMIYCPDCKKTVLLPEIDAALTGFTGPSPNGAETTLSEKHASTSQYVATTCQSCNLELRVSPYMKDDAYEHMLRLCLVHCDTWASKIAHCRALSFHLAKRHEAEASIEYDDQAKFILVQIDKMQVLLLQYDLVADKLSDNETRGLEDLMNIGFEDCSWATKEMQFYIYWLNLAVCMRLAKVWSKHIEVIEVLLGKLKTTFQGCQTHLDRRLKASLDRRARRIAESIVEGAHRYILIALLDANNCNSKIPVLDGFVVWRSVQPLPTN